MHDTRLLLCLLPQKETQRCKYTQTKKLQNMHTYKHTRKHTHNPLPLCFHFSVHILLRAQFTYTNKSLYRSTTLNPQWGNLETYSTVYKSCSHSLKRFPNGWQWIFFSLKAAFPGQIVNSASISCPVLCHCIISIDCANNLLLNFRTVFLFFAAYP